MLSRDGVLLTYTEFLFLARGASLADFIQPSLGPLQPNLDDFMDTLEPLHGKYDPCIVKIITFLSLNTFIQ